jgi:hypothetical protein
MAKRLRIHEVAELAPRIESLLLAGKTKEDICKELDIFMGAVNLYLRRFASAHICELAMKSGREE